MTIIIIMVLPQDIDGDHRISLKDFATSVQNESILLQGFGHCLPDQKVCLCMTVCVCLSVYVCLCVCVFMSVCLFVCLPVYDCMFLSVCLYVCLCMTVRLSVYLS